MAGEHRHRRRAPLWDLIREAAHLIEPQSEAIRAIMSDDSPHALHTKPHTKPQFEVIRAIT